MATDAGVAVDRAGFNAAMAEQRARAKRARKGGSAEVVMETYRELVEQHDTTDFTGRDEHETKARVLSVMKRESDDLEVFLDRTPFYAESGGQVGDIGTITTDTGRLEVTDTTYALPGLHRHTARLVEGEVRPDQEAVAAIDVVRRQAIRRNHTGTHLLHWALREVLGEHVKQQGSLVAPDYLRFDFSHHRATSPQELARVEDLANGEVLANDPVRHYETTKAQAAEAGAIAFFGDKYGEIVRVLEAGRHSVELCGGTHVGALGDIGPIRITSESSIGSNQRRIFATTGTTTLERVRRDREALVQAATLLAVAPDDVVEGLERLRDALSEARDQLKAAQRVAAGAGAASLAAEAVDGVVVARRDDLSRDELKDLAVAVREQSGVRAVVLGAAPAGGGVALVAAVVWWPLSCWLRRPGRSGVGAARRPTWPSPGGAIRAVSTRRSATPGPLPPSPPPRRENPRPRPGEPTHRGGGERSIGNAGHTPCRARTGRQSGPRPRGGGRVGGRRRGRSGGRGPAPVAGRQRRPCRALGAGRGGEAGGPPARARGVPRRALYHRKRQPCPGGRRDEGT
jgi:alanyl-tRNA synthetase